MPTSATLALAQLLSMSTESRQCAGCNKACARSDFSKTQWTKGEGTSRCISCVAKPPASNSKRRDDDWDNEAECEFLCRMDDKESARAWKANYGDYLKEASKEDVEELAQSLFKALWKNDRLQARKFTSDFNEKLQLEQHNLRVKTEKNDDYKVKDHDEESGLPSLCSISTGSSTASFYDDWTT